MARVVELRRHTDNDDDVLSAEGVAKAIEIGASLRGDYELAVSSGAQRATQTIACFLAGLGQRAKWRIAGATRTNAAVEGTSHLSSTQTRSLWRRNLRCWARPSQTSSSDFPTEPEPSSWATPRCRRPRSMA